MKKIASVLTLGWLLSAIAVGGVAQAQRVDSTVAIGQSTHIWSRTLQEQRRLLIHLPKHYAQSNERYPVLYLLDAEAQFAHTSGIVEFLAGNGRIPELIVVGVTNTNRMRDLTPASADPKHRKEHPTAGGADPFLAFLADELAPWVNANYRTQPYRILAGHSLGGLFAVHALINRPQTFQAYLAVSPSLWWNDRASVQQAKARLGATPPGRHFLRLTWGDNENVIRDSTAELIDWLKANPPPNLQWSQRYYAGDDHGTTPHRSHYDGLEELFANWQPRFEIDDVNQKLDLAAIEAHYANLSQQYGFTVRPTADAIDHVARNLADQKDHTAALELRRRNVRDYPWLAEVHASLADTLVELNRPEEARREYDQALQLQLQDESPYQDPLVSYREKLEKLTKPAGR
ncbi:alpha/beta hydrolase [Peristeroidobacter soli]|uniref:alpha/beta hydrolase n=1 Tax=Peristeroidobacter soli TaxID=2497877 RepID=UPI00101B9758|nr:alpha/beta hydrolase-fold protein [Peristeroidobacter soli]